MAIKTFTTGEVLTASDTNTYLANAGLVYVTSTTIGSAVSSVTVSNCFSNTYDNYKIVVSGGVASGNIDLQLQLGSSTTGYYSGLIFVAYASVGVVNAQGVGSNNAANWPFAGNGSTNVLAMNVDIMGPNLAKPTGIIGGDIVLNTSGSVAFTSGFHNVSTSYTGFTIAASSGTLTGGTVTVYGYRKA